MNFVVAPLPVLETDLFGRLLGLVAGRRQTLRRYPIPLSTCTCARPISIITGGASTCAFISNWRCQHIFEVKCPEHDPIVVFDNSSGHGAYADDALQAQKMSCGWGGKQARMRDTSWVDLKGKKHKQSMVFTGAKQEKVVSSFGGRKKKKEDPDPPRAGQKVSWYYARTARTLIIRNVQD
jgi:hypothetical protein